MIESDHLALPTSTARERLVLSRGNLFSVTTDAGDIAPSGARDLGLFKDDTRHLSHYELILMGKARARLSAETEGAFFSQIDLTASDREPGELLDEPINYLHVRRKQLLDEEFLEQLIFTNFLHVPVELVFEMHIGADFADVFEVRGARRARRGETLPPKIRRDALELSYRGCDARLYRTLLRFAPAPLSLEPGRAVVRLCLLPGEAAMQEIVVSPARGESWVEPSLRPYHARSQAVLSHTTDLVKNSTRLAGSNPSVIDTLDRALTDLYSLRILHEGRKILGAGIPWFAAPFGRDAILTSAQLLGFAPDFAVETLQFLATYQGTKDDPIREEEPGKIMHELRRGEMACAAEIPHSPYFGTIDATPLYVVLAAETFRWTADLSLLRSVWPSLLAAMAWLERKTERGTRFLTYAKRSPRGLENQGWKDSRDGVSFPDGRRARAPIALIEVQGYLIDAYRSAARLATALGEDALASTWAARVEPLWRLTEEAFWNEETSYFALALDGTGQQVPTFSSNPGHLLWSRCLSQVRAERVAEVLLSPGMYSGYGIRTVGQGQAVYNPLSYHNGTIWPHDNALAALGMAHYGLSRAVLRVFTGMLDASSHFGHGRLPELFCGLARGEREFLVKYPVSCSPQAWASGALFMMLQATLGLEPDAPRGRLRILNPRLPRMISRLDLLLMRIGSAQVSLRFVRSGRRTHVDVLDVRGGPLRVMIEVD